MKEDIREALLVWKGVYKRRVSMHNDFVSLSTKLDFISFKFQNLDTRFCLCKFLHFINLRRTFFVREKSVFIA